ncbi:VacJ family lipoprotein [Novispirillum sp. DQ9]|uniref:MlaA family lipoprotein n=1 Tax=Novispirillum sp. DQ9 TaxID=3398612 RepID=UPI003C7B078B
MTSIPRTTASVRTLLIALGALALTACAATPQQADDKPADAFMETRDPLEPVNRGMHTVNQAIDKALLRPLAIGYREGVPGNVRMIVRSGLRNLKSPIILANDLLQGNLDRAGVTAMRMIINTTIGMGGIADVATDMGFPYHDEDFGQTLAVAGVDGGPYVVLPLLGPSNVRDTVGLVVDTVFDPLRMYTAAHDPRWADTVNYTRTGLTVVDRREALLDPLDEVEKSSIDTYAGYRTMYRQLRAAAIANSDARGAQRATTPMVEGSAFDFEDEPK